MKKYLLCISLILALGKSAIAADPATPMADVEPQATPPVSANPGRTQPAGAGLDDFAFGIASQPASEPGQTAAGADVNLRDDEYRTTPMPQPVLEGF